VTPAERPAPGLPFSINFLAEPGMEHLSLEGGDRLSVGIEAARAAARIRSRDGRAQ
jgi:hypothetical protein